MKQNHSIVTLDPYKSKDSDCITQKMQLGKLKKQQPVWTAWMKKAVETLNNSDEVIAHYKMTPMGKVLMEITFEEFGPPIN